MDLAAPVQLEIEPRINETANRAAEQVGEAPWRTVVEALSGLGDSDGFCRCVG